MQALPPEPTHYQHLQDPPLPEDINPNITLSTINSPPLGGLGWAPDGYIECIARIRKT